MVPGGQRCALPISADPRAFGVSGGAVDRLLDLARAQAMARHVDHVIRAAKYEPVAVGIHPPPVEGRIHLASGDRREVAAARSPPRPSRQAPGLRRWIR
ncbi:hypothetical protein G6F23_014515 [Rhizopus arrhizus]|nr:hypothetical protein G6F23_014515 [Rhizopus arrhizus]